MKRVMLFIAAVALASPAFAQHVHEQAPAAPPAGAQGRGPQVPPIEVPWNDAIPAGTADHAARVVKESPRHGEWVDIKMADGTVLKSWVVYPERPTKTGVVLVSHHIPGMADMTHAVGGHAATEGVIGACRRMAISTSSRWGSTGFGRTMPIAPSFASGSRPSSWPRPPAISAAASMGDRSCRDSSFAIRASRRSAGR